jgi:hypothetical protein
MHATAPPWHAEGRPQPTGVLRRFSARSRKGQQGSDITAVGLLESGDVLLAQS